ncbi:MAG TPA: hypothetical protein VF629_18575 [Hymenobacter sp.]|jgi:hypothetical protein|uniref:hypothetical protein n=1 Tax=Hymenobacter sp. TaxID=1898978 RepID=UPI002ED9F9EE
MYVHFDFSHSPDTRSYLRMGAGRFDSIRVTHRYRVLVPAAAGALAAPIAKVYGQVWPQRPAGQWPLRFAFYLLNCGILAVAAACWYNGAVLTGSSPTAAVLAMLAVLTSRWAAYAAGLPLTDSLYLLVFGLAYYSVRRGPAGKWALVAALVVGPLSKESFFLLVPWLLWFGRHTLSSLKQLLGLAAGATALLITHHFVDSRIGAAPTQSVSNAWAHLANITYSLHRAASPKGLGEVLSIFGLFTLIVPLALVLNKRNARFNSLSLYATLGRAEIGLLAVVGVHMLLSGDLGRMGYLAAPAFCAALALAFTHWQRLVVRA